MSQVFSFYTPSLARLHWLRYIPGRTSCTPVRLLRSDIKSLRSGSPYAWDLTRTSPTPWNGGTAFLHTRSRSRITWREFMPEFRCLVPCVQDDPVSGFRVSPQPFSSSATVALSFLYFFQNLFRTFVEPDSGSRDAMR